MEVCEKCGCILVSYDEVEAGVCKHCGTEINNKYRPTTTLDDIGAIE